MSKHDPNSERERCVGAWTADTGERVEVIDVVDGAPADEVAAVQTVFSRYFPDYPHTLDDIAADASLPSRRDGVVVHQWLIIVDDTPSGIILFESNLVRQCGPVLYFAVDEYCRTLMLDGNQLSKMSTWLSVPQMLEDGGPDMLGGCAERHPTYPARLVRLDVDYAEPVGGRRWRTNGTVDTVGADGSNQDIEFNPMSLHWTPSPELLAVANSPGLRHDVSCKIAAAFLVDHYQLPHDHPHVQRLAGSQADLDVRVDRWPLDR
jgi:hypothetical protein